MCLPEESGGYRPVAPEDSFFVYPCLFEYFYSH